MKNIKNNKYGKLLVISENKIRKDNKVQWDCLCDCGNTVTICGKALRTGKTKSCGCLQKEKASMSIKKYLSNNESPRKTHGMTHTRIYEIWKNMLRRCNSKNSTNYNRYGGRGIKVDKKWFKFENFHKDMKDGYDDNLTIDRINNDGNYCKQNCKWSTIKEQQNNRSSCHIIEFGGEKLNIEQWANKLGIPRVRLQNRINKGWELERALTSKKYAGNHQNGFENMIVALMSKRD